MDHEISDICRDNILTLARAFADHRQLKFTSASSMCHGDPKFLNKLSRRQGSVTTRKYDEVIGWFKENWPEGLPMPEIRAVFVAAPGAPAK